MRRWFHPEHQRLSCKLSLGIILISYAIAKSMQNRPWHSPRLMLHTVQRLREILVPGHVILIVYLFTAKRN